MKGLTLVAGASPNPLRYSNKAIQRLVALGYPVCAIGRRPTEVAGVEVHDGMPEFQNVHTITLYLNAENQKSFIDYFLSLKPQRVIFNPGTYNPDFEKKLRQEGIEVLEDCTLVMLNSGDY